MQVRARARTADWERWQVIVAIGGLEVAQEIGTMQKVGLKDTQTQRIQAVEEYQ